MAKLVAVVVLPELSQLAKVFHGLDGDTGLLASCSEPRRRLLKVERGQTAIMVQVRSPSLLLQPSSGHPQRRKSPRTQYTVASLLQ